MGANTYEIGNQLFVALRAFLMSANIDPSECEIVLKLPDTLSKYELANQLKYHSPPISEFGRASAAQAGNFAGVWQGVPYELDVKGK